MGDDIAGLLRGILGVKTLNRIVGLGNAHTRNLDYSSFPAVLRL